MSGECKRARAVLGSNGSGNFDQKAKKRREEVRGMNEFDEIDANLYRQVGVTSWVY